MTITISDPVLLKQFAECHGEVDLTDPKGTRIGVLTPIANGQFPAGFEMPFSDEEFKRLRKQRDGRPFQDVIRELEAKG